MPEHNSRRPDRCRRGFRQHVRWAGSSALAVLAGISVIGAGTAAALAGTHASARRAPLAQCDNLCVSVQALTGTVTPGQAASFGIHISPSSPLDKVTVQISLISSGSPSFPAPTFTSCGDGGGTQTCTVGLLQAGQATDLGASARVPGTAPGGERATLAVTVSWDLLGLIGTGSATGSATIDVAGIQPSPTPTPHPSTTSPGGGHPSPTTSSSGHPGSPSPGGSSPGGGHLGTPSSGLPGGGLSGVPGPIGLGLGLGPDPDPDPDPLSLGLGAVPTVGGTGMGGSYSGLFPLITPLPTAAEPGQPRHAATGHTVYRATAAADILPLNMWQLGIQTGGLIVLALGITFAVVRIPLRRRRAR